MKTFTLSILLLSAFTAQAQDTNTKAAKVALVKTVIPKGKELAGAYVSNYDSNTNSFSIQTLTGDEYVTAVKGSYLMADLNKDSLMDLVVITEDAPRNESNYSEFGTRTLMIYLGTETGTYRLETSSSKVVLKADEGGAMGDPLAPLEINSKGSLVVSHYGGSSDRWATKQIFQYRTGAFYLIGEWFNSMSTLTMAGTSVDTNLITGDRITTKSEEEKSDNVTKTKVPVQPLQRLDQAELKFE